MQRVSDFIADYLQQSGINDVFLVSGGGMMFLSDGVAKNPGLHAICHHHEQAAAMAAVAHAKFTGTPSAVMVTTGCGGTNAITGLLGAWQDNTPVIFISGQCKRAETIRYSGKPLRQFGVQEADIIAVVSSLTKYAVMVDDPQRIAYELDKAVAIATSGRPGPVWLDIPLDIQAANIVVEMLPRFDRRNATAEIKTTPTPDDMELFRDALTQAKRPVIIMGQGVRLGKAIEELQAFIHRYRIPVVASRLGIDILPSDDPLFIGRIGNKGDRAGNFAVQNADLVIAMGSRLSVSSTGHEYRQFAREAMLIVVDIDPAEHLKQTVRVDHLIAADIKCFLTQLLEMDFTVDDGWCERCLTWKQRYPVFLPEYVKEQVGVNLYAFIDVLSRNMPDHSVVISDAGSAFYVTSQGVMLNASQRYITTGGQAEMGYTIPATIGVSFAAPGYTILGITGDGSFQMNMQELQTIVHHRLPIKLFVWNNDGYLSIRATQQKFCEGRLIGTDPTSGVSFPALEKIAQAFGIPFFRINNQHEMPAIIKEVIATNAAVICEVICLRDQEIVPTVSALKRADGTIVSKPLEDMYPFLPREEFAENMIVKPLDEVRGSASTRSDDPIIKILQKRSKRSRSQG